MTLPEDVSQLPDIFIYLNKGAVANDNDKDTDNICFIRIKPQTLMTDEDGNDICFRQKPRWFAFTEDKCIDALSNDEFTGRALLRLGFGPTYLSATRPWPSDFVQDLHKDKTMQLRIHLYQAWTHTPSYACPSFAAGGVASPPTPTVARGRGEQLTLIQKGGLCRTGHCLGVVPSPVISSIHAPLPKMIPRHETCL